MDVDCRSKCTRAFRANQPNQQNHVTVLQDKLAAIGVRISRWVTSHGFALNAGNDLSWFDLIVPCGIPDRGVTSLERLLGHPVPLEELAERVAALFGEVYAREMLRSGHPEA